MKNRYTYFKNHKDVIEEAVQRTCCHYVGVDCLADIMMNTGAEKEYRRKLRECAFHKYEKLTGNLKAYVRWLCKEYDVTTDVALKALLEDSYGEEKE
jgi:hypothetical protein